MWKYKIVLRVVLKLYTFNFGMDGIYVFRTSGLVGLNLGTFD